MSRNFEELDHAVTPIGELVLRRRRVRSLDRDVWEVTIGGAFLMSSLVNDSEVALAEHGLAALRAARGLDVGEDRGAAGANATPTDGTASAVPGFDVVVGGLGLGCTAAAALDDPAVRSLRIVELLPEVLGWHERRLVPLGERLTTDPRCRLAQGDVFALARGDEGFDPSTSDTRVDALLLDVDHSPAGLLHPSHGDLYEPEGLRRLTGHLRPRGVFALWSSEPPEDAVTEKLASTFASATAHAVTYENPLLDREDVNTVYVATTA